MPKWLLLAMLAQASACARTPPSAQPVSQSPDRASMAIDQIAPLPRIDPRAGTPAQHKPATVAVEALRSGIERFEEELWAEAAKALESALEKDTGLTTARVFLARSYMQLGRIDEAVKQLQEALKLEPRSCIVHLLMGEIAWQQGRAADAIQSLRLALSTSAGDPKRPERVLAHLTLALALRKEGYYSAAAEQLESYLGAMADPTPAMLAFHELASVMRLYEAQGPTLLGEIYSEAGDFARAAEAFDRALKRNPDSATLLTSCLIAHAKAGHVERALELARRKVTRAADDSAGLEQLREVCDLLGKPELFNDELTRLARESEDPGVRRRLAEMLLDREEEDRAVAILNELAQLRPPDARARLMLAGLHLKRGRRSEALELLSSTLGASPRSYGAVRGLMGELLAQPQQREALEAVRAWARQAPRGASRRVLEALAESIAGDRQRAIELLGYPKQKRNPFGPRWSLLAELLLQEKRWSEAIEAADEAIALGGVEAHVHVIQAKAHAALDEVAESEAAYTAAMQVDPKSAEPLLGLAELSERRGDRRRCEQLYRRVVESIDPKLITAREKLIRLLLNTDRADKARQYFAEFSKLGQSGPSVERCQALLDLAASPLPRGPHRLDVYRESLRKIVERYPEDAATRVDLAMSYVATREYEPARKLLDEAAKVDQDDPRIGELQATILSKMLDFAGAAGRIRELLRDRPRDANYQQRLAEAAMNQADLDTAARVYGDLAERRDLPDARPLFVRRRVEALVLARRWDEAVAAAKQLHEEATTDASRRQLLLTVLSLAKRHDEAIETAQGWLERDPMNLDLRMQFIEQLRQAGREALAQVKVLSWMSGDPDDIDLNYLFVRLLWSAGNWDAAIEHLLVASEQPLNRGRYQNWLGQTYLFSRRYDDAVQYYRDRVRSAANEQTYRDLIAVLIEAKRYDEAERTANELLQPQMARKQAGERFDASLFVAMQRLLSRVYQLTDRLQRCVDALEAIRELTPDDPGINNDLGYTLADAGLRLDDAEKMIRLALEERPAESAYLDSWGWLLYKRERLDEALTYLRRSVALAETGDPVIYDHLGDALYRTGDVKEAKIAWEKAHELCQPDRNRASSIEQVKLDKIVERKLGQLANEKEVSVAPTGPARVNSADQPPDKRSKREMQRKLEPESP